jgi:hypothetical protein
VRIAPLYLSALVASVVAGCSFSIGTGSGTASSGGSSGSSEDPQGSETPKPATVVTPESKAWFEECSGHYDELMKKWKPVDDEAQALSKEAESAESFYTVASKISGQLQKTCVQAKETGMKSAGYGDAAGTALTLRRALAKLQLRTNRVSGGNLFDNYSIDEMVNHVPTTGDDWFDRNAFCLAVHNANGMTPPGKERFAPLSGTRRNSAHWLTADELEKFNKTYSALTKETADTLNAIAKQYVHTDGEVGKIKSVKKLADGSTAVTAGRVESPYECKHTGVYTWNGSSYNDCTIVDLPAREIYPFSATFKDPPPVDLKAGDWISFSGTVGGKVPDNREKGNNAKWEGMFFWSVTRGKKTLYEVDRVKHCY